MAQFHIDKEVFVDRNNSLFDVVIIADKNGNIVNSSSASANINISSGRLEGYSAIHKFGAVPSLSGGGIGSIWGINDTIYPWEVVDAGGTITLNCFTVNNQPSSEDNGGHVHVYGLDENFNPISEIIEITGSVGVGTVVFHRINDIVFHDGLYSSNKTKIFLNMSGVVVGEIEIGFGRTSSAMFTIPAGFTGFLTQGTSTCSAPSDATVNFFTRSPSNGETFGFTLGHTFEVSGVGGQYFYQFAVPFRLQEKTDIDVRVIARQNNTRVTGAYDLVLVDNNFL